MTAEETTMIKDGFQNLNEKMDLVISPIKDGVTKIEAVQIIHSDKIGTLELFKEGHQTFHATEDSHYLYSTKARRFYWEFILAAAAIVVAIIVGK